MNAFKSLYITLCRTYVRRDLSAWEHEVHTDRPVYGMYHVYCARGWQSLVAQQIAHLRESGLWNATSKLYVTCNTVQKGDDAELRTMLDDDKIEIVYMSGDRLYEYPALEILQQKCRVENCYFYYFHTKGVSYVATDEYDAHFIEFKRNLEAWRALMEYFMMDKWRVAVNVLSDGYDSYGCYRYPPAPAKFSMYAGNFWWATSDYVKTLVTVNPKEMSTDRMFAEKWIYSGDNRDFSPFDTLAILYRVYLPYTLYKCKCPPLIDVIRFVYRFNFTKIAKKVFKYDYVKHDNDRWQK